MSGDGLSGGLNNGHRPYSKGWRAPWRGQWGTFADGHCRVAKLARLIHRQLVERFAIPEEDAVSQLLAKQAARQGALAEALAYEVMQPDGAARRGAQKRLTATTEGFRRGLVLLESRLPRTLADKLGGGRA
jgi:hypothetical protein